MRLDQGGLALLVVLERNGLAFEQILGAPVLQLRQIKAGLANGDLVEVIGNLKPRELIVTKGALFIDRAASGS